jgi:DnaJ-class molecular chaperone
LGWENPQETAAHGVGASNVGGAAHNGVMNDFETCERCEGSGADPRQAFYDDEVTLCIECRGDGVVVSFSRNEQITKYAA